MGKIKKKKRSNRCLHVVCAVTKCRPKPAYTRINHHHFLVSLLAIFVMSRSMPGAMAAIVWGHQNALWMIFLWMMGWPYTTHCSPPVQRQWPEFDGIIYKGIRKGIKETQLNLNWYMRSPDRSAPNFSFFRALKLGIHTRLIQGYRKKSHTSLLRSLSQVLPIWKAAKVCWPGCNSRRFTEPKEPRNHAATISVGLRTT